MPEFTFRGFSAGSSVNVSATQDAETVSNSVIAWGQVLANVDIVTHSSGENVAPYGVYFEALVLGDPVGGPQPPQVYNPRKHELTYVWDFDDAADAAPLVPLNMPDQWKNRNVAYGFQAAHVFRNSTGTDKVCNVTCKVYYQGDLIGQATETITIKDPDTEYTGTRTAVFSNDVGETWAGAPAGAQQLTTESQVQNFFANLTQSGRLLLKRGQSIDFQIDVFQTAAQNVRIGSWGTGDRPIINVPGNGGRAINIDPDTVATDFAFYDLDIRGQWDPKTESGDPTCEAVFNLFRVHPGDPAYVWDNVKMSGLTSFNPGTTETTGNESAAPIVICNDLEITSWWDYGIFLTGNKQGLCKTAVLSSTIYQDPGALHGKAKNGWANQHGAIRVPNTANFVLSCCDLFSANGWSPASGTDLADIQGGLRLNSDASLNYTHNAVVERMMGEGGWAMIGNAFGGTAQLAAGNYLFDKIALIGGSYTQGFITWNSPGTTFRNILCYQPNVPSREGRIGYGIEVTMLSSLPLPSGYYDNPISIYNVTLLNLIDASQTATNNAVLADIDDAFTHVTVENNIHHSPNQTAPATADGPIDLSGTIEGFNSRYEGTTYSTQKVEVVLASDVPNGGSYISPYPYLEDGGGGPALTQSDFGIGNGHAIRFGGTRLYEARGDLAVSFGAGEITVTNNSGSTIPAGTNIVHNFVRNTFTIDTRFANPSDVLLPHPDDTGSSARDGATSQPIAREDLLGVLRPIPANSGALEDV